MDSFTMLFQADLSSALQGAEFDARVQRTDRVVVSKGDAYLWILICKPDVLDPSDFEDEDKWPIPRDRLRSVLDISVRRNVESEDLAVKVADQLVTMLAGAIMCDGTDQWESRYKAYLARK